MCEEKKSYKIEIFITIIALATALISNWDKIIPKEEEARHPKNQIEKNPTLIELPASFDCRKAQTNIEKVICKDPSISHADGQLGILYKQVKHKVSENKYKNIKKEQKLWENMFKSINEYITS